MRRIKWRQNTTLWSAQILIAFLRAVVRIREATLPEHKRTRLRQLRLKLEAMDKDQDVLLDRMKTEKGWKKFDALDEFVERHADPKTLESRKPHQEQMLLIRQESENLQAIRHRADGDLAVAVVDYRKYLKAHPESYSGYSYLGSALRQAGDLEGSLSAYRKAIRLSGGRPIPAGSARLSVADILHTSGRTDAAIAELRILIDTADAQNEHIICMSYNSLGDILSDTGDRKAALQAWKQALRWDTTGIIARNAREKIRVVG